MESKEMVQGGGGGYCMSPQPYSAVEKRHAADPKVGCGGVGEHFTVEDLLDFSNDDSNAGIMDGAFDCVAVAGSGASAESSTVTVVDSCNSTFSRSEPHFAGEMGSRNFGDNHFSGDLCVPYDDLAELEWLSNFVEESFSSEDLQRLQVISGMKAQPTDEGSETRDEFQPEPNRSNSNNPIFRPEVTVPGKARSKRSRAAPCNWTSRLLVLTPTTETDATAAIASGKKAMKGVQKDVGGGDGRKCLHCATDKTPQWRTGPMGPKTLCNACGVRYKSGRLVPEYRPAASPTFVLTKHSNSHRKVLELRRQKEMMRSHSQSTTTSHQQQQQQLMHHHHHFLPPQPHHHHHHQGLIFDVTNGDDYLIHQHMGPDFRQMI